MKQETTPHGSVMVAGPKAEVKKCNTHFKVDIVALVTALCSDKKCHPDVPSKVKGQCFYKASEANVLNCKLLGWYWIFCVFAGFRGST